MRHAIILLALLGLTHAAYALDETQVRDQHREVARAMLEISQDGLSLSGTVSQNGSEGVFHALFFGERSLITKTFGDLQFIDYSGPEGSWTGSNFDLPYKIEDEDAPYNHVLSLFGSGKYLEDEYWPYFTFVSEEAGGYVFNFAPPDLPPVRVVLFSDADEPWFLQPMSVELTICPSDPDCLRYRAFYSYDVTPAGRIYLKRETGRDIDNAGNYVNFSEYNVEQVEPLAAEPAELSFNFERQPVGGAGTGMTGPVEIPISTDLGYFTIPMTFPGNPKTFRFIFDTGASAAMFTPEAAEASGLVSSMNLTVHGHGTREQVSTGLVQHALLGEVGGETVPLSPFHATTIPAESLDLLGGLKFMGVDGIMSNAVLQQYVVTFDFLAAKLVLWPKQLFDGDRDVPRPNVEFWLDAEDLIFFTRGTVNGTLSGEVVLDSGLQTPLALQRETLDTAGMTLEKIYEQDNTVVGGVKSFDYVGVGTFELGPVVAQDMIASITDDDQGSMAARGLLGFLGMPFFGCGKVTVDLFAQRAYVEPYGDTAQGPFVILMPENPASGDQTGETPPAPEPAQPEQPNQPDSLPVPIN